MAPDNVLSKWAAMRQGGELGAEDAHALFAAMLAGDLVPRELAAILAAWRNRPLSLAETIGFVRALDAHTCRLDVPTDGARPIVLPAHHGTRRHANLTALIAMLLKRYETPVLVHAPAEAGADAGRVPTADVLWELGVEPAANLADAQARITREHIAFVPWSLLAPGLARLAAAPAGDPPPAFVRWLAKLIDPFGGEGMRVIGAGSADELAAMREFLLASRTDALLFHGTEDEPFADPRGRTRFEHMSAGSATLCADAEASRFERGPMPPAATDAAATATWIANVLAGTEPVPPSIVVQLGCCLAGARRLGAAA